MALCFLAAFVVLASFYISEFAIYTVYRARAIDVLPAFNKLARITGPLYLTMNGERYLPEF